MQIRFILRRMQYICKCFTNRTVHVWCKKMLDGQKFVSYTEVQSVVLQSHEQQFFATSIQKFADR